MSEVLRVQGLEKRYSDFSLEDVSFSVSAGKIMGFIGRNGAGKTTTLKALMNLVHPDGGQIEYFGLPLAEHEREIKQRMGFCSGGVNYYARRSMKDIADVARLFYDRWDDDQYHRYLEQFSLDEQKRPIELSEGMKVKFNLALALSHHAELLLLDEPTSGLDPVSRDDLLDVFLDLAAEGVAILFSTHVITDLDKCADSITYIKNGRILASCDRREFIRAYRIVDLPEELRPIQREKLISRRRSKNGDTGLVKTWDSLFFPSCGARVPTTEDIMVHLEKEAEG